MGKIFLSLTTVVTVLGIIIYFLLKNENTRVLGTDVLKLSIQLILIVVFGGILIQEYNRRRERKEALNEFRKTVFRELVRSYTDVKRIRRILRANCVEGSDEKEKGIPYTIYEEQINKISDIEIRLETVIVELKTFDAAFAENDELNDRLQEMEHYLNDLVVEYENISRSGSKSKYVLPQEWEKVKWFISRAENKGESINTINFENDAKAKSGAASKKNKSDFAAKFEDKFIRSLELVKEENLKA